MKKCLVIGGTGLIGNPLVKSLINNNRQVRVLSDFYPTDYTKEENVEYIHGNYSDIEFVKNSLIDCDEVIHLAHSKVNIDTNSSLESDVMLNLIPSIRLFELCRQQNIRKIIFASSGGTVYGQQLQSKINENHLKDPISNYGLIKLMIEEYARMQFLQKNLPIIIIRPSNVYGEGQLPFIGQGFIATAIASIIEGKKISIYGDGKNIRDYIYISDVVEGIISVLDYGVIGEAYNISTGIGYSLNDIIKKITDQMPNEKKKEVKIEYISSRITDISKNILTYDKLKNISAWTPKIDINSGLHKTLEWISKTYGK